MKIWTKLNPPPLNLVWTNYVETQITLHKYCLQIKHTKRRKNEGGGGVQSNKQHRTPLPPKKNTNKNKSHCFKNRLKTAFSQPFKLESTVLTTSNIQASHQPATYPNFNEKHKSALSDSYLAKSNLDYMTMVSASICLMHCGTFVHYQYASVKYLTTPPLLPNAHMQFVLCHCHITLFF